MSDVILIAIGSLVSSVLTALGMVAINWIKQRSANAIAQTEQDIKHRQEETKQALIMYEGLINRMQVNVDALMKDVDKLEEQNLLCIEDRAALRVEVRTLHEERDTLRLEVQSLKERFKSV